MLWDCFFANLAVGAQPWVDVTPGLARERVRAVLRNLDVPDAKLYGTHDFRRGHAEDLRQCGASLAEILLAGQWKSAAFLKYLDEAELEKACRCALGLRCVRSGLLVRTSCLKPLSRVMRSCSLIEPSLEPVSPCQLSALIGLPTFHACDC